MKGIIFNLLEDVVTRAHGPNAWDSLLDSAGVDGVYTSLGNYPDDELDGLIAAASRLLDRPVDDLVRWFGRSAIALLATQHPHFFTDHRTTRSFLLTLNDIIHAEVRKLYPDALVPVFELVVADDGAFGLGYSSPRALCALAEGFVEGAAVHYGEKVTIDQPTCMHRGDDRCLIVCRFRPG